MPANLTAGKGLGFKVGTQNSVNSIISAGSGAVPGSFYLAEDTHRLYIGNDNGTLSAVNEGVVTVAAVANLPTLSSGTSTAYQGQFYYCTQENILCVCSGTRWVQINPDTYLVHNDANTSVTGTTANGVTTATISNSTSDQGGTVVHTSSGDFSIRGSANVGVSVDSANRIITLSSPDGATYTLTSATRTANDSVNLVLTGSNGNSSTITLQKGDGGVYPSLQADGTTIKLDGGGMSGAAYLSLTETNGVLTLVVSDAGGNQQEVNFKPQIKIGNTEQTVLFDLDANNNLVADLNVYTIQEVNDLIASNLRTFDAMYFAGTIGSGGTGATSLSNLRSLTTVRSGATFKFISAIDTVPSGMTIEGWKQTGANSGDMLIVTGTETNGYLDLTDSTNTIFTFIPSADDTTEVYVPNFTTQKSLRFVSTAALGATHTATFEPAANSQITISGSVEDGDNFGGKTQTITIGHATMNTTTSTATDLTTAGSNSKDYTAITGLTLTNGHVTGYQTQKITIVQNMLSKVTTTTAVSSSTDNTTGITTTTALFGQDYTDTYGNVVDSDSTSDNKFGIASDTLSLTVASAGSATGSAATPAKVKVDMIWGSF